MTMNDREITDLVRQILARYNLGRQQYKQLKLSRENNREQQQMLYAELKVLGWILGRNERDVVMEING